ncbi:MAG TPA: type II toxin-antitoxin system VapC family toxin [Terriglobales bacterium]|nr:type II toxin-antitoxin system VapC family toxin [Terriglobales bacterium]
MTSFVLDASVAAKWMLPAKGELLRPEAFRLLDAYGAGEVTLIVPDIFWAECGNIVWKATWQKRLRRADAEQAILSLIGRNLPTIPSATLLQEAVSIAFDFGCSVYDCLYVALAAQSKKPLITADEQLANALASRFPLMWLGAF